jgi:hypothetical protein
MSIEDILAGLHSNEQQEIYMANQRYISQISQGFEKAENLDAKLTILCNVTSRFFNMRKHWLMISPHKLETVEPVITTFWLHIRPKVTPELRLSTLNRSLVGADDALKTEFYAYADRILPL